MTYYKYMLPLCILLHYSDCTFLVYLKVVILIFR